MIVVIFLIVSGVMVASGSVFVVSAWYGDFIGLGIWIALVFLSLHEWNLRPLFGIFALLGLSGCCWLCYRMDCRVLRTALLGLALVGVYWVQSNRRHSVEEHPEQAFFMPAFWASLGLSAFLMLYESSPCFWLALKGCIDRLPSAGGRLGIWVSGLPIYLFGSLIVLARSLPGGPHGRTVYILAGMALSFLAGRALLSYWCPISSLKIALFHLASMGLISFLISRAGRPVKHGLRYRWLVVGLSAMVMIALYTGLFRQRGCIPPNPEGCSVGIYSHGFMDWGTPAFDRVGLVNSGLFGLFRKSVERHVERHGGRVVLIDSLTAEDMRLLDLVIFINPNRAPSDAEIDAFTRFIRLGGSTLVLGDHTDIFGSRGPLNAILRPTAIRFNFDSAIPLREDWRGCLEIRPHPTTRAVEGQISLQMGVGASLDIEKPAFPIILGKYSFSDAGDPLNIGKGAYMGNTTHDAGEALGDIVLVAGQYVGAGRVLVFGDTSPFQNTVNYLTQQFITNVTLWLTAQEGGGGNEPSGTVPIRFSDEVAIVDCSLKPAASISPFGPNSIAGLANCLARLDIVTVPALDSSEWADMAAYLFLISPRASLNEREANWLLDYAKSGGHVVLSQGYLNSIPINPILKIMGFTLRPVPLGSGDLPELIKHSDAWALSYDGGRDTVVLAAAFGYPTVVGRQSGRGSFTLISDGRFLIDQNLEGERDGHPQNITLVTDILRRLRKGFPYAPKPTD